jgi:N6-adenosine-specific RNA methylase IME4
MKKYQIIYADPPWEYGNWGKNSNKGSRKDTFRPEINIDKPLPYSTMTIKEIKSLSVELIADINCDLYIWVTQKYLPEIFGVIKVWGFKYCQTLIWCKKPRGLGQGGLYCPTTEFLILARKGKMPTDKRREDSTWWQIKRPHNSHSTKPEFFRDLIEKVSNEPRIELFAREKIKGWDVWGNEVENDIEI